MRQHSNLSRCKDETAFGSHKPRGRQWPKRRTPFISTAKDFDMPFSSVLQEAMKHYKNIAIDDEILCGTPRITGTRIPIYMILDAIEFYGDLNGALKSYPQLSLEQVKEAVCFAGQVLERPVDF